MNRQSALPRLKKTITNVWTASPGRRESAKCNGGPQQQRVQQIGFVPGGASSDLTHRLPWRSPGTCRVPVLLAVRDRTSKAFFPDGLPRQPFHCHQPAERPRSKTAVMRIAIRDPSQPSIAISPIPALRRSDACLAIPLAGSPCSCSSSQGLEPLAISRENASQALTHTEIEIRARIGPGTNC